MKLFVLLAKIMIILTLILMIMLINQLLDYSTLPQIRLPCRNQFIVRTDGADKHLPARSDYTAKLNIRLNN